MSQTPKGAKENDDVGDIIWRVQRDL